MGSALGDCSSSWKVHLGQPHVAKPHIRWGDEGILHKSEIWFNCHSSQLGQATQGTRLVVHTDKKHKKTTQRFLN